MNLDQIVNFGALPTIVALIIWPGIMFVLIAFIGFEWQKGDPSGRDSKDKSEGRP